MHLWAIQSQHGRLPNIEETQRPPPALDQKQTLLPTFCFGQRCFFESLRDILRVISFCYFTKILVVGLALSHRGHRDFPYLGMLGPLHFPFRGPHVNGPSECVTTLFPPLVCFDPVLLPVRNDS